MKLYYGKNFDEYENIEEELMKPDLKEDIKKTRYALEIAYAGFENALEPDMIDSYIYEINSLQKRYNYLVGLAGNMPEQPQEKLYQKSPIRALVSHVFG